MWGAGSRTAGLDGGLKVQEVDPSSTSILVPTETCSGEPLAESPMMIGAGLVGSGAHMAFGGQVGGHPGTIGPTCAVAFSAGHTTGGGGLGVTGTGPGTGGGTTRGDGAGLGTAVTVTGGWVTGGTAGLTTSGGEGDVAGPAESVAETGGASPAAAIRAAGMDGSRSGSVTA